MRLLLPLLLLLVLASPVAAQVAPPVVSFLPDGFGQLAVRVDWTYAASAVSVYQCGPGTGCALLGSAALTPPERSYQEIALADPGCSQYIEYYAIVDGLESSRVSPCPTPTLSAQLVFPVFSQESTGPLGASLFRALIIVFGTVLIHQLYFMFGDQSLLDSTIRIEDILIVFIFSLFQLVLLWMPERFDLQVAAFAFWLLLFIVRKANWALVSALTRGKV